jgi:hypothetical protein
MTEFGNSYDLEPHVECLTVAVKNKPFSLCHLEDLEDLHAIRAEMLVGGSEQRANLIVCCLRIEGSGPAGQPPARPSDGRKPLVGSGPKMDVSIRFALSLAPRCVLIHRPSAGIRRQLHQSREFR